MKPSLCLGLFAGDERGAVTTDWVALAVGSLLACIAVVWGIFNGGMAVTTQDMNVLMVTLGARPDPGKGILDPVDGLLVVADADGHLTAYEWGAWGREHWFDDTVFVDASGNLIVKGADVSTF